MAYDQKSLDDYIDVAQRIADFRAKYPEGTLQPYTRGEPFKIVQAQGFDKDGTVIMQTFVVVVAAAYRDREDPQPGVGMAWEIFPGRTPYTRGSELQNAETSAWGRAIIAVGASDSKRGIASREEVRNRQAERDDEHLCAVCFHPHAKHNPVGRCKEGSCGCASYTSLPSNADGSLSRSRTTDDQKAAAGVMTDPQQRAHNQLAKPPPNTGPVESLGTAPVDDPWYDNPAPLADLTNPEDRHGTATADQIKTLHARLDAKGVKAYGTGAAQVTERQAQLAWLQHRFGADIHSSKDLSYTQAAQALQELTR